MKILGVDPGSVVCGYGVIEKQGNLLKLVEYGVIEAKRKHPDFNQRLKEIYHRLSEVIKRTQPDEAAFESIFFAKNAQSLIKLSHARGSAIVAVAQSDISIAEYSAREVKKAVTGRGAAGKEQVQYMVKTLLNITETHHFFDATDALAVAICHSLRSGEVSAGKTGWADYIKQHPELVINR